MGKSRKRRRSSKNWFRENLKYIGLVVAAAIAVGLLAVALNQPTPSSSRPLTATTTPPPETPTPEPTSVAFLGDSLTAGVGADKPSTGYASLAGKTLGWPTSVFGYGGTGYTVDFGEGVRYGGRVDLVIEAAPDIVIIQGSTNDYAASSDEIYAAAKDLYAQLSAALPDATLVVLGPLDSPDSNPSLVTVAFDSVQRAAADVGIQFVDARSTPWLDVATDFSDGFHPNQTGHEKMAAQLSTILSTLTTD